MASRYWVGGTANWDGTAGTKWALTSGGAGGEAVPTSSDDVFFDANSGAVTVNLGSGYSANCQNLDFSGFTGTFGNGNGTLNIFGSCTLSATVTWRFSSGTAFRGTGAHTITSNGTSFTGSVNFFGSGTYTLQDALTSTLGGSTFISGTLDLNNKNVSLAQFAITGSTARTLTMGTGTLTLSGSGTIWDATDTTNLTFNKGTSTIKVDNSVSAKTFIGGGLTYYNIWIAHGASLSVGTTLKNSNTFNQIQITKGMAVTFEAGTTQTITTLDASGWSLGQTKLASSVTDSQWMLSCSVVANISQDYLQLQDSRVSGGACWFAGANSTNLGNNNGWQFTAPTGVCGATTSSVRGAALLQTLAF